MPDPFAHHFGRALGLPAAEAERALDEIVDWLHYRLDVSSEVHIDGLGTFRRASGELSFTPALGLRQAVNYRYAGLRPVTTPGAPPSSPAEEKEAEEQPDPFADALASDSFTAPSAELEESAPLRDLSDPPESDDSGQEEEVSTLADNEWVGDELDQDGPEKGPEAPRDEQPLEATPDESPQGPPDEPEQAPSSPVADAQGSDVEHAEESDDGRSRETEGAQEESPEEQPDLVASPTGTEIERSGPGEDDEVGSMLEGVWTPRSGPAEEDHPLGPMPPSIMEDAEFSVVDPSSTLPPLSTDPPPVSRPGPAPAREESPRAAPSRPAKPPLAPSRPVSRAPSPFDATREPSKPAPAQSGPPVESRRSSRWIPILLGSFFLLALIGGILWWLLTPPPDVAGVFEPTPADGPVATAPGPDLAPDGPDMTPEPFPPAEPAPADEPPLAEEPAPPEGPLRGTGEINPAQGGYTWVVASEGSRAEAQRHVERFRNDGYRASVLPATVGNRTVYRVGVGQFDSTTEAERLRPELPPYAPADTWRLAL